MPDSLRYRYSTGTGLVTVSGKTRTGVSAGVTGFDTPAGAKFAYYNDILVTLGDKMSKTENTLSDLRTGYDAALAVLEELRRVNPEEFI